MVLKSHRPVQEVEMDEQVRDDTLPSADSVPMQAHTCTAVVEELVADTPEGAWDDVE